jgi:hypothetical protein
MNDPWLLAIPIAALLAWGVLSMGFATGLQRLVWKHERRLVRWKDLF